MDRADSPWALPGTAHARWIEGVERLVTDQVPLEDIESLLNAIETSGVEAPVRILQMLMSR